MSASAVTAPSLLLAHFHRRIAFQASGAMPAPATLRLLAADGELDGSFIGLRLRFDDDESYVRDSSLEFDGTTSAALAVDLDLRFSLIDSASTSRAPTRWCR